MIDQQQGRTPLALAPTPEPEPAPKLLRLDLGCGQRPKEGFEGVDIAKVEGLSYPECDLFKFPWPWDDSTVDEVYTSHFFEHVPQRFRFRFMDELWRVLKPGMRTQITCPYYNGARAVQDPTHQWPPICEGTFLYFNKGWREANKLDHYQVKCDFDFVFGYTFYPEWQLRSEEARAFAMKHYTNVIMDIHVSLVKRS